MPEENNQQSIELDFSATSPETIEIFLDESDDEEVYRQICEANRHRPEVLNLIYSHENTPESVRKSAAEILHMPVKSETELAELKEKKKAEAEAEKPQKKDRLIRKIGNMNVSEKVKLAKKGSREARTILIKDSNKQVIMSVLDNPKLTISEVELIARSRSLPDEAMRFIGKHREWMKNYSVLHAFVTNPKAPPGMVVGRLSSLKKKDLEHLKKDRGVSEAVRTAAKRLTSGNK